MNAFTYVLIFLVVEGFADLEFGNSEESNKLQQLVSEIVKSNVSVGQILIPGSNRSIYLTINNFFFNSTGSKRLEITKKREYIKKLENKCVNNSECSSIPYAVCSSGNCSCSDNYFPKNGKCVGLLDESCKEDSDCGVSNSSCQSRICKCRSGFNSTDNKICFQYATDYGTPVASAEACRFLEDAVYAEGKCYKRKKLHESCSVDEQCADFGSACYNRGCQCKEHEYYEHKNRCYAPKDGKCNTPEDCALIWFDCISGTCQDAAEKEGDLSSKPGATAVWKYDKYDYPYWSFPSYFNASTSHDVGDPGNLAWVKNYTLDRVVAFDAFYTVVILCRTPKYNGEFFPGKVRFNKNNKLCQVHYDGYQFSTKDFEVYVDLGPEN